MVMRVRPVNPNTRHKNLNTLFLGMSGTGKSQAMANHVPRRGARVVLWDNAGDHAGIHTESKKTFIKLLRTGIRSNRGFRVAFAGNSIDDFEWFCEVYWSILDGDYQTYMVAEELSQISPTAGKASPNGAVVLNQCRKFGGIFCGSGQKPQEISKTFFDQCEHKYIGHFRGDNAIKMAKYLGKGSAPGQIENLKPLEFIVDNGQAGSDPVVKKLKYKPVTGVRWV